MRNTAFRRLAQWGLLVAVGCPAWPVAAASDATRTLDLQDALRLTLAQHPALLAAGHQLAAQQGRVLQAGLRPNLELDISIENATGTGDFSGLDRAETTLSLAWVLERGKRQQQIAAAQAGVSLVAAEAELARVEAAAETARLYLGNLALQARKQQVQQAVDLAAQTIASIEQGVTLGKTASTDLIRAEVARARAALALEDISHQLLTARYQLAAQWGERTPGFNRVAGSLQAPSAPEDLADLLSRIDGNPALARFLSVARVRQAEVDLAKANARPSWNLHAGIRRLEANNDHALVAGITMPLAFRNQNQGRIAEARARLSEIDAEQQASRLAIETHLFTRYQELLHTLHTAEALRNEVLPRLEQVLADTQTAYQAGRYDYYQLQLAQAELLTTRTDLVDTNAEAQLHIIEIERLTGTAIRRAGNQP